LEASTWDNIFVGVKEKVWFVDAVINCSNRFVGAEQQTIPAVSIEDYMPAAFPQNGLHPELYTL
jgi:hypothetical protein